MTAQYGQQRSPQIGTGSERCKPEGQSGSMGAVSTASAKHGSYEVGASGENSNESNTVVTGEGASTGISGKLVRQLVNENEKQLAYHEQQAKYHQQQSELTRQRIEELKQIPENFANIEHQE
jgi:hypothetical protein